MRNSIENLDGLFNSRFVDRDRLKPSLQRGILLDIFTVFGKGCGTNDLNFPPGKGWFQNIGCIHTPLCIPCADQIMYLVNHQDDVAAGLHLGDEALHPALKLAPELGPGHKGGQIQQINLFIHQLIGYIPICNPLRQPLGNGCFTDAGFPDQARIVFLAAVQDLDDALCLGLPSHHMVQAARARLFCQIEAVIFQKFLFLVAFPRLLALALVLLAARLRLLCPALIGGKQLIEKWKGCGLAVRVLIVLIF